MAFMYPFHAPVLPMKWDDAVWVQEVFPAMEHALLATIEQKRTNQVRWVENYINVSLYSCLKHICLEEDSGDDH
uniref:CAP10 domain-containing protein n=1 Tax=Angiostrongylus cantonensis TaxID=6313 RepID=A0A0K0DAP0_ANGCA